VPWLAGLGPVARHYPAATGHGCSKLRLRIGAKFGDRFALPRVGRIEHGDITASTSSRRVTAVGGELAALGWGALLKQLPSLLHVAFFCPP